MLRALQLAALIGTAVAGPVPPNIHVFGHKIPDTDAICAAMVYVWEVRRHTH